MSKTIVPALELRKSLKFNYDVTFQELINRLFLVKDGSFNAATLKKKKNKSLVSGLSSAYGKLKMLYL